jgi:hypothetical protein
MRTGRASLNRLLEGDSRLRRRLLAIEKLEANDKRQALPLIDAFIERGQVKSKVACQIRADGPHPRHQATTATNHPTF